MSRRSRGAIFSHGTAAGKESESARQIRPYFAMTGSKAYSARAVAQAWSSVWCIGIRRAVAWNWSGSALVIQAARSCHDPENARTDRRTPDGWFNGDRRGRRPGCRQRWVAGARLSGRRFERVW